MKQWLGKGLLGLVIVGLGLGAAQETAKNYFDLNELGDVPGTVKVATDYLTIIEFEGHEVEDAATARSDLYVIEYTGNVIRIRANAEVVNTDLYVRVAGRTVLFKLESDPETTTPRRYVVRDRPPPQRGIEAFSNPGGDVRPPSADEQPLFPQGLLFEADLFRPRQHEIVIQYRLINESTHPIVNDPFRLRVYYGDTSIGYNKESSPTAGRPNYLSPGEAEYGQIVIPQAPTALEELELEWTLIEVGPGTQHRLVRNLGELATGRPSLGVSRAPVLPQPGAAGAGAPTSPQAVPEANAADPTTVQATNEGGSTGSSAQAESTEEGSVDNGVTDGEPEVGSEVTPDTSGSSLVDSTFEQGSGAWRLDAYSEAEAVMENAAGETCVDVSESGVQPWDVSLSLPGLTLTDGHDYLLSFDGYADKSVRADLLVTMEDGPYTGYVGQSNILDTDAQTFEHTFTLDKKDDFGLRLVFFLGGFEGTNEAPYRVCLDNIRLVDLSAADGQEADNTSEEGLSEESSSAESSALLSSDFEGDAESSGWKLLVADTAEAVRVDEGGEACVTVTSEGEKRWYVSLQQLNLDLKRGSYTFSFDAYANKPAKLAARVALQKEPWTNYTQHYETLQTAATSYRYTFEMLQDESESRVQFNLGGVENADQLPYTVCLDNVHLARVEEQAASGGNAEAKEARGASGAALFVVDAQKESPVDVEIVGRLESLGYSVTLKDDEEAALSDAEGKAVIIVSASISSNTVDTIFKGTPVPLVTFEEQIFSALGMTGPDEGTDFEEVEEQTRVRVLAPEHPLSAGLSEEVAVSAGPASVAWGVPAAGATIVAALPSAPDRAVVFAYETDAQMVGATAPARRVGLFHDYENASYNENGWALFDAAVQWAVGGTVSTPDTAQSEAQAVTAEATSDEPPSQEVLLSSSFEEGDDAWNLQVREGAKAQGEVVEGEYCVTVDNGGAETWQVSLQIRELPLQVGRDYTLSWSGRSERPVIVNSRVFEGAEPWGTYKNWETTLGSSKNSFTQTFTAETDDPGGILEFQMGADYSAGELPVRLCFDDIELSASGGEVAGGANTLPEAAFSSEITALHSQLCLNVSQDKEDNPVAQQTCDGAPEQQFEFRPVAGGSDLYFITSQATGTCLAVADSSPENTALVRQTECSGEPNQQFTLSESDQGFRLAAQHSGKCLDIVSVRTEPGTPLQQYACHDAEEEREMGNQTFLLGGKP